MADLAYDLVVLGGGPGGYIAAIRAAQLGLKTAVVERDEVGGVCLNWGCIPSKALLRNAEIVNLVRSSSTWGISVEQARYDMGAAVDRSRTVVGRMVNGVKFLFKKHKIDLYHGAGQLASANTVVIEGEGKTLQAKNIIVATGARARDLPNLRKDGVTVITSREALALKETPKAIVVVGGGAVGVELAYFWRSYGSNVTIVEMLPHLLPGEDEEVSQQLERSLKRQGIDIKTGSVVTKLEQVDGTGNVRLSLAAPPPNPAPSGGSQGVAAEGKPGEAVECDRVLMAVGVLPNSDGLGLEKLGVATTRGFIQVNERMATNVPGIHAIGDVTGKMLLAHVASAQGVAAAEAIAGQEPAPLDYGHMPRATYCQPQVASMGLTEKAAQQQGYTVRIGKFPFAANGKAVALGAPDGFVKLVTDAATGEVLGAHLIGHDVTDLLAEISMTHSLEGTALQLGRTVHAHPTLSEAVMEAGLGAVGESLNI